MYTPWNMDINWKGDRIFFLEKTITMGDLDLNFQGSNKVQLISRQGRTGLTKMDARIIISAVERHIGGI